MKIGREYRFEAAHWLPLVPDGHKCRTMHGHNYRIEVTMEGDIAVDGFVMDFAKLDRVMAPAIAILDHSVLNDTIENPTAENICIWLYRRMIVSNCRAMTHSIKVYETDRAWAEYP